MSKSCSNPIPWETLVDYWAGELTTAESDRVDEHLFGCTECTAEARRVASVTEALRAAIPPAVSRQKLEALLARGLRIHESSFLPDDRREVVFAREADLVVHRLGGLDLGDAERVSFRIRAESTGVPFMEIEAAPFEQEEGAVLIACQRHYAAFPHDTVFDISIHGAGGAIRTATYTILHRFA